MFVNNQMVGRQDSPTVVYSYPRTSRFLIGAGNPRDGPFTYADMLVDEVEVWYADRDQLVAFDYLLRGEKHDSFIGFLVLLEMAKIAISLAFVL